MHHVQNGQSRKIRLSVPRRFAHKEIPHRCFDWLCARCPLRNHSPAPGVLHQGHLCLARFSSLRSRTLPNKSAWTAITKSQNCLKSYRLQEENVARQMTSKPRLEHLHQTAAHQVERLLTGILANARAISREFALDYLCAVVVTHANINQPYWLLFGTAARSGNSGHA
jgi:hypothetical protein